MALIKCSECGKEISDKAVACPSCGNPIANQQIETKDDKKIVEVELTGKKWKKKIILGILLFFVGWIMLSKSTGLGVLIMLLGVITVISAKLGSWWTNG